MYLNKFVLYPKDNEIFPGRYIQGFHKLQILLSNTKKNWTYERNILLLFLQSIVKA